MSNPVNIFIAYSRSDDKFLDELRRHLMPLTRAGRIQVWYDGEIEAGRVWEAEIKKALAGAEIIVLMVSSDSIASDYFYGKEVAAALDRHENGTARVVPLIIRACQWAQTPLKNLQAVPKNGLPVANWTPRDDAWFDAVEAIGRLVADIERERLAAVNAIFEKERLEKEAETVRLAAIAERERLEKKAASDAEKKRQADEAARARAAEKTAEQERTKKEPLRPRPKEPKREQVLAERTTMPAKAEETSEWQVNLAVGGIIAAILVITGFLFFKTKACISQAAKGLDKKEQPAVAYPAKRDSTMVDSTSRPQRGLRVIDSEKIGVQKKRSGNSKD